MWEDGWLYYIVADIPDIFDEIHWTGAELLGLSDHIFYSYLDIFTSWKINQPRSLYHQSDKFPFLPNLLLIEAAINQFGLKLKLVLYQAGGGGPLNRTVSAILLLHVIVLLVAVKIFAGPWLSSRPLPSLCFAFLPSQLSREIGTIASHSLPLPFMPGFHSSHSHFINLIRIAKLVLISIWKTKYEISDSPRNVFSCTETLRK